ncbi:MAG: GNAT family N-acetyltransferase [Tepidisphaeraceae bacterium]
MDIRPANAEDVSAVLPMVAKTCALHETWDPAKYGFLPNPHERYRRWLTQRVSDPRSVFIVAQREQRIVAFLIGTVEAEIPIYRVKEFGFVHDLWVEEEYRNEGIARQMVMLAIERFKALSVSQVRLDTAAANEPARKLFASCGFRLSTMEMLMEL